MSAELPCCVVSVGEGPEPCSCSGVILCRGPGLVLCHAAIFSPFLQPGPEAWSRLEAPLTSVLPPGLRVRVLHAAPKPDTPPALQEHEAQPLALTRCEAFAQALTGVAASWCGGGEAEGEAEREAAAVLPWFAWLRVPGLDAPGGGWTPWSSAGDLRKGAALLACGSPFGALCPDLFLNTLSGGVLSNAAGEGNALLLTDARCLPGTQGGAVLVGPARAAGLRGAGGERRRLGLGHAAGPVPAAHLPARAASRRHDARHPAAPRQLVSATSNQNPPRSVVVAASGSNFVFPTRNPTSGPPSCRLARCSPRPRRPPSTWPCWSCRSAPPASSPPAWPLPSSPVSTRIMGGGTHGVFVGKPGHLGAMHRTPISPGCRTGEAVLALGFGALGRACGPSVTGGVLSAVVGAPPVMLQSTCAVHAGSSGGPLLASSDGRLLGIVASNARDNAAGATYPHLNFCVPITLLQPPLARYLRTGDPAAFAPLDAGDEGALAAWRLQQRPPSKL
uniref:Peroxisomal leader peptide-processing protease n=1 Tax=Anser cygnoides TaxID=8845 RepID=A0A8B9DUL2_ANSCY